MDHLHLRNNPPPLSDLRKAMRRLLRKHPDLSHFGFGVFDGRYLSGEKYNAKLSVQREAMLEDRGLAEFHRALVFLAEMDQRFPRKSLNWTASSYGWKHTAENFCRRSGLVDTYGIRNSGAYVSNGTLIAAALHLEIPCHRIDHWSPNAVLAVSKKVPGYVQRLAQENLKSKTRDAA